MNIREKQYGNTLVVWLLVFIFLLVTGFAGYKIVYQPKPDKPAPASNSQNTPAITSQPNSKNSGVLSGQVYCTSLDSRQPCATRIEYQSAATNPSSGSYIQPVVVDASGKFSIELEPGSYTLFPERKPDYPQFIPPLSNPVEIKAEQTTNLTINYHDGTR